MSLLVGRILTILFGVGVTGGLALGAAHIAHQVQQLSVNFGAGFVLIVALMTVLVLISIVRMPLSHASVRRRHR